MIINAAVEYAKNGYSVFPALVAETKKPLISGWKDAPREPEAVRELFSRYPNANAIGIPTGKTNGIFVLDIEASADTREYEFPPTPCYRTGGGGMHYWYIYEPYPNAVRFLPDMDTRSDAGLVIVPPSAHPKGFYEWIVRPEECKKAPIPGWVRDALGKRAKPTLGAISGGVMKNHRNDSAASVLGHVLSVLHEDLWLDFGWKGAREWNRRNTPPLDEKELWSVFKSIAAREKTRRDDFYGKRGRRPTI